VRDEHSNEMVGEVTAFSGSLEVYSRHLLFEDNRRSETTRQGKTVRDRTLCALDRPARGYEIDG